MSDKPLDLTDWQHREYQTREGLEVKVLCVDKRGTKYTIVGLVKLETADELETWDLDGLFRTGVRSHRDLINAPRKIVRYVNIARNLWPTYPTREKADAASAEDRIACPRVEFEEGQYDD